MFKLTNRSGVSGKGRRKTDGLTDRKPGRSQSVSRPFSLAQKHKHKWCFLTEEKAYGYSEFHYALYYCRTCPKAKKVWFEEEERK